MKRLLLVLLLSVAGLRAESVDYLLAAANDADLQPLLARLESPRTETRAAWQFQTGTLAGRKVVLVRTEGDPLNAVAATTLALRRYTPKLVITYGTARPHDPTLHDGDLVISGQFAAFDGLVSHVTPLEGGIAPLTWERLPHLLLTAGEKETPAFTFPADAPALAAAKSLPAFAGHLIVGTLGSAHQVNAEADRIAWLHQTWGTSCEDGESAHIAGCARLLGVPVIGLRIIRSAGTSPQPPNATAGDAREAASAVLALLEALQ